MFRAFHFSISHSHQFYNHTLIPDSLTMKGNNDLFLALAHSKVVTYGNCSSTLINYECFIFSPKVCK